MLSFFTEAYQLGWLIFIILIDCILMLVILPMIFWFTIIPKIENRMSKKLVFSRTYSFFFLGKYLMGALEIGTTIALMYFSWKIFKDKSFLKFRKNDALILAKYDIECASKAELSMGLIYFICMVFFIFAAFAMFLIPRVFPLK